MNRITHIVILLILFIFPTISQAWWNKEWDYRKELILDLTASGAPVESTVVDAPILIRLHLGNFGYFQDTQPNGADLRFVAGDDVTPLKYHVESYDPTNQIAVIWVKAPQLTPGLNTEKIYMYYGNLQAPDGGEPASTYDPNHVLVYHFDKLDGGLLDSTAYSSQPSATNAELNSASLIGAGVQFGGENSIVVPSTPSLRIVPANGTNISMWIKPDQLTEEQIILNWKDPLNGEVILGLNQALPYIKLLDSTGAETAQALPSEGSELATEGWSHISVNISAEKIELYINGILVAEQDTAVPEISGEIVLGSSATNISEGYIGLVDEFRVSNKVRSKDWILSQALGQGITSTMIRYGQDGQQESGHEQSYFAITLQNVTVDGWVVIIILAVMAVLSWVVMIVKGMAISRIRKFNKRFITSFRRTELGEGDIPLETLEKSGKSWLFGLIGDEKKFKHAPLFRLYKDGIQETNHRLIPGSTVGSKHNDALSRKEIDAIRATLDAAMVREQQKLNSQMVWLTLSISGGPFLGLLGTVVGVMITFAAIAAAGDVNVNAIAPGIAAALVATVAGLVVAIPALFGYNYLGSRIKEILADHRVFVDEFIAKLAEQHG